MKVALGEALKTVVKGKPVCEELACLQKELKVPPVNSELWISLPRTFSRSSAIFELPMDSRTFNTLTPIDYVKDNIYITSPRKLLYNCIFEKYRMENDDETEHDRQLHCKVDSPTKSTWRLVADVTNNVDNNGRKNICLKSDANYVIGECLIVANMFNVFFKNAPIENGIVSEYQHGFQAVKSTNTAVYSFYETLTNYIDADVSFDCVDHTLLINKLENIGIKDLLLKWIESYLSERRQYVSLSDVSQQSENICKSDYIYIHMGVPQGSVIGPILFLIYLNDIVSINSAVKFTLYADDTSIRISDKSHISLENKCNELLCDLSYWFSSNYLHLNADKTHAIHFHNRQKHLLDIELSIYSKQIEKV
ncbi:unnamed protein product [Diabrotica balteata]|uniref:Reverse transcriptase domain-containing protein n=1 Tax=Diabrotica balteata TaxID=107213 RepID=A0A9N9SWL9_DIABA|nr:unnamed protein product [Diabrotica balteata]